LNHLFREIARLLKPGGVAYFETPDPKTINWPSAKGQFTLNFYDDPTHVRPVAIAALVEAGRKVGLNPLKSGTSRNWMFAAAWPFLYFTPPSRQRFTAHVHWGGWSAYVIMEKPA